MNTQVEPQSANAHHKCQCRLNFPHYCRSKFPQSSGRLVFSV